LSQDQFSKEAVQGSAVTIEVEVMSALTGSPPHAFAQLGIIPEASNVSHEAGNIVASTKEPFDAMAYDRPAVVRGYYR
jgi:hypothetical protein